MASPDKHQNLERLARLRAEGILTEAEFSREKELLLHQSDSPNVSGSEREVSQLEPRKRRLPVLMATGLVLCGGAGWAMTEWARVNVGSVQSDALLKPDPSAEAHETPARLDGYAARARELPDDRQVELAFDAVFGEGERVVTAGEEDLHYRNGAVVWSDFGPVLIAEANGEEYPESLGALGIFYLREVPGPAFKEIRRWPDAVTGSIMGNPPRWKVRNDILEGLVIESTFGGVWQGYACNSSTLTQLTSSGPVSLVTFNSGYDSTGAVGEDGERYSGTIAHIVRDRSFDVAYSGTHPITEHYVKKGSSFVRVPAPNEEMNESPVPTC